MDMAERSPPTTEATFNVSKGNKRYVLGVLLTVYVTNMVDRQILAILMEPIKLDLKLSDSELGFLSGAAFAIFYAIAGLPIARLADRTSRVKVMATCLALWSLLTALSGMATSYVQLLLARIGVGVGEAGGTPPSHSLISDYFSVRERGFAMGVYSAGVPLGILVGLILGGWINELFNWRVAFFVVGIPGLLMALVVYFTVKEPPRGAADGGVATLDQEHFLAAAKTLLKCKTFRYVLIGSVFSSVCGYGTMQWIPPYFMRTLGMTSGEVGTFLGIIIGLGGVIGSLLGGKVLDFLSRRDVRWFVWLPVVLVALTLPLRIAIFLLEDLYVLAPLMTASIIFGAAVVAPEVATIQSVASPSSRSVASAVMLTFQNLVGLGLGPIVVGVLSDAFAGTVGLNSLRYALISLTTLYFGSMFFHFIAGRHIVRDMKAAQAGTST